MTLMLYRISPKGEALTCHLCDTTTAHPKDVADRFCRCCGMYLDDLEQAARQVDGMFGGTPSTPRTLDFFRDVVSKLNGRGSPTHSSETTK